MAIGVARSRSFLNPVEKFCKSDQTDRRQDAHAQLHGVTKIKMTKQAGLSQFIFFRENDFA